MSPSYWIAEHPEQETVLGPYVISFFVRRGGMASIYLARHQETQQRVAIKLMLTEYARDPAFRARFQREGALQSRMRGVPYIAEVLDQGELQDGRQYLVLEWVEGEDLHDLLEHHRNQDDSMHFATATDYALGIAKALDALHARRMVHRDLKPSNVMVDRQTQIPKLVDFGLVADMGATPEDTTQGTLGTDEYTSPEQGVGAPPHPSMDIWGYGATLLEMYQPFHRRVTAALRTEGPGDFRVLGPKDLQGKIRRLIQDCLSKEPAKRPTAHTIVMYLEGIKRQLATPGILVGAHEQRPQAAAGELVASDRVSIVRLPNSDKTQASAELLGRNTVVVSPPPFGTPRDSDERLPHQGQETDEDASTVEEAALEDEDVLPAGVPQREAGTTKTDWRRPAPASHEESGQTQRSSAADAFAQPLPPVTEYTTAIPLELLRQHLDFPKDTEHTSFIPKDSEHTSFIPKDTEHTSFIPRDAERPSAMGRESAEPSGTPREVAENTELTNAAGLDLSLENDGVPDPIEREATKPIARAHVAADPEDRLETAGSTEAPEEYTAAARREPIADASPEEYTAAARGGAIVEAPEEVAAAAPGVTAAAPGVMAGPRESVRTGGTQPHAAGPVLESQTQHHRAPLGRSGTQPNRSIVIPDVAASPPQLREEKREKEPAVPPVLAWTGIGVLGLMLILGGMRALLSTSESPANVDAIAEVRPAVAPAGASATATTPPKRTSIADEASKPPPLVVEAFPSAEPAAVDSGGPPDEETKAAALAEDPQSREEPAEDRVTVAAEKIGEPDPQVKPRTKAAGPRERRPKVPAHTTAECEAQRQRAEQAALHRSWTSVVKETERGACWSSSTARMLLRLDALLQLKRFERCATEGSGLKDPQLRAMAEGCRKLSSERAK